MREYITRNVTLSPTAGNGGLFDAVLAVQEDIGDGFPVRIQRLSLSEYRNHGVVLMNHKFADELPVGRTETISVDGQGRLVAQFRFLENDPVADRVRNAWEQGVVRSASITVRNFADGEQRLIEWSIVSLPADVEAVARSVQRANSTMENEVEEANVKEEVGSDSQLADLMKRMEDLEKHVAELESVITSRNEEMQSDEATQPEVSESADNAQSENVESRMALLHQYRELLPEDLTLHNLTAHGILTVAVGDTVPDATSRSTDYLMAKAEGILAERHAAKKAIAEVKPDAVSKRAVGNVMNIMFETILEDKK